MSRIERLTHRRVLVKINQDDREVLNRICIRLSNENQREVTQAEVFRMALRATYPSEFQKAG